MNVEIVRSDAQRWLVSNTRRFDVVFLDPPFSSGELEGSLASLRERGLAAEGVVYAELPAGAPARFDGFEVVKESRAGDTRYLLLVANGV